MSDKKPVDAAVTATWCIELTCHGPHCGEYVDLTEEPDFWDGRHGLEFVEHGTPRTTGMEVTCPNCGGEFKVNCTY